MEADAVCSTAVEERTAADATTGAIVCAVHALFAWASPSGFVL